MPCYCDTPDEDNQVEIERRCKERMYFDVQAFMTDEQVHIAKELKIGAFPFPDVNTALCRLCAILEKEQMELISAYHYQIKWLHVTLYDWFKQHMKDDETHKESK